MSDGEGMDSNALLQRWRLASRWDWQLAELVPGNLRYADRKNDAPSPADAQRIVDILSARLTGRLLSASSNKSALDVLAAAKGNRDERTRAVAVFIAQLPECNLR